MCCLTIDWKVIKTLVFDLGNVLIPFDWQRGYRALADHSPYSPEEIRRRIKEMTVFDPFERGEIEPRDLARKISANLEMNIGFEKFRELWSSIFLPGTLAPDAMLAGLRARRRLLLLSNTDAIHYGWVIENYPIMRHFDDRVVSFEVGFRKPEPEIYRETIARAGCLAAEIFFADDRPENVQGALEAGIDAVQFESLAQLELDLKSRGVAW
jgi:FMN phosphatase YigB (HAD superfamily)